MINRSHETILLSGPHGPNDAQGQSRRLLHPAAVITSSISRSCSHITFVSQREDEKWTITPTCLNLRLPLALGASVKVLKTPDNCPWTMYLCKV